MQRVVLEVVAAEEALKAKRSQREALEAGMMELMLSFGRQQDARLDGLLLSVPSGGADAAPAAAAGAPVPAPAPEPG
eukprot:NODE_8362_length_387_cov_165.557229.p3 GENE.NODE_8362_length_387_cov_165.557229~~NODE_8362_length_387_cov_165.557229.p3  ORF type:complete len:77 (+),score=28.99 NODE_8362_length_387_cov_165.557229:138-368(+)